MVKNTYGKDWKNWRDPSRLEHHFQTKAALRFSHDREVLGTLSRREKQLTSSATTTLDWDRHNFFNVTLTGDTTFEVINPRYDSDFVLYVKKDDNSTERTITFPSDWTWLEGSPPDALRYAEERVLIFVYYYNEEYFARFNQFSSSASGYTARDLYSFGAIGDGVTDDTEAIRAALDWGASGGENGRAIHVTSGEYLMSSGAATISLPNYSKMAIIGDGAGAGSILVANTQGGIHINCEGSSSIVSIYDLYIPAHYEGAGPLLKVAGQYNGSGGGVDFNTLIVQNVNGTPLQRSTSRYYSLNPFIFTRLKRPYIENARYTPGKLSFTNSVTGVVEPRDWGTALMDLSNSYGPTVIGGKLGGSADYGILMDYTGTISVQEAGEEYATEGGYVHDIRITQTKNGVGYYTDTEQPGLKIDGNHFNSSYRNIVIDGAKRFRIDNNFLYANNDTRYFWSKVNPGDTLLTITSDEPHRIPNLADMLVRVNFSPEDTEDQSYDTDNDGTNDVSPSGTYDVTYISTTSFSIDDPLFAALPQTGNLQVRWSTADFSDNKIINGRHGRISQNMYGFLSSRRRKHWDFEDSESVKADPVLFDIQVYDESLTARTELEPLYIGPTADFITVKLSKITGDGYDRVGYPDNMSIVDDAATRITVIDSEDSFEERNEGGTINLIPNGRFAKGQRGWDRGAGWEVENDNTAADTENSLAVYTATDTSKKNLMMKVPVPCDDRRPVAVDIVYKVQAGTVTTFRPRISFYDAAGVLVELKTGVNSTATPSTYTLNRQRIVPPVGAKTMLIGAQAQTSADGIIYVDRIIGSQGTPDFDVTDVRAWGAIGDGSDETSIIEAIEASNASYVNLGGLSVTTTLSPDALTKSYFNGRVYGEDVDGNIHLRPNHSVIYDSEILKKSTQTPFLDWEGATILSLGTSIQAEGSGSQDSYPELAAGMLGATCINMAWAGSSAAYDNTGDHTEIGTVKRLSMTQDDVDWGIATWGDVDTNVYSDLYPGINKASKMTMDYRVVAQMAAYSPDVILIEHNRNDMDRSPGVLENESRAISSVSLGATTTLTLASGGLVIVGDAVRLRVTGISKLDYYVARVQAVSGVQITLNLDSSGFAGSFVSGTCYKVDRQYFCEALGAIISQIYWASTYYGVTTPAIVLTSAPSEYDSDSYDYRVRSNAQYVKDVADYWDVGFFDLNASLAIDANNHTVFFGDTIHPVDLVSRQAIANHLAAYLAGGKLPSLRKAQVLLRAQTNDFNDGASVVYDAWNEGFKERDWKVGTISTAHTDDFSSGLGGYTLTGTAPTTGASPWDGGNTALSCTHDGISGTSYIQKTGLTLGEYTKVSFKIYLDSTVGLTSAGTTGTLPIMHLQTGSVHHAIQLIIKETAVSMSGYVIPAGTSPATIVPRSKALSDATVHEITYEVIKGNGTTIDGSCILTFDGERISLPLTFDDSTKSVPDRVFLGIISNTGDMPIEVWFDDLTIETGSVVTTTVSDFARTVLDDTSASAWRSTLGLVIGTDVQPYNANTFIMETLSAARTYYVRTDGSDSNTGLADTAGGAFLTINKAIEVVAGLNFNRQAVTIQVRDGTFPEAVVVRGPFIGLGTLSIVGNTTTPANCVISPATGAALAVGNKTTVSIGGFKLLTPNSYGLSVSNGSVVDITGACDFGECSLAHMSAAISSRITRAANITVSGAAGRHIRAVINSSFEGIVGTTVTITGTPAFSTAAVELNRGSNYFEGNATAYSGAATGFKYQIDSDCSIRGSSSLLELDEILPGDKRGQVRVVENGPLPPYRNLLLNASGLLQNGASGAVGDDVYGLHDRWYVLSQSGNVTPSTVTDLADGNPQMIRLTNSHGSSQRFGYAQILSSEMARPWRGKRLSVSLTARESATTGIRVSVLSWSGTADTLTSDVVNSWTNTTFTVGNFFTNPAGLSVLLASTLTPSAVDTLDNLATSTWIADVPSDCNNLIFFVHTNSAIAASATVDFRAQLEVGLSPTPFDLRPAQLERKLVERRIQRVSVNSINGTIFVPLDEMAATPTVTVVSGAGTVANATKDGFHLTHTSVASHDILCTAEL